MTTEQVFCRHCGNARHVTFSCQEYKNGRVRLRVDCEHCGCFSHYVPVWREIERAIEKFAAAKAEAAAAAAVAPLLTHLNLGADTPSYAVVDAALEKL